MLHSDQGQLQLSEGLACDIREAIHRYDGTMPITTAIGVLEIIKAELIDGGCRPVETDDDEP